VTDVSRELLDLPDILMMKLRRRRKEQFTRVSQVEEETKVKEMCLKNVGRPRHMK
jgi:hypothetical protein